jgi:outer membrane protein assembly factor BamB
VHILHGNHGSALFLSALFFSISLVMLPAIDGASAADWPQFRGPEGDGHAPLAASGSLPTRWSESENVRWKTAIDHKGWSSPVVSGGKVWMTTATEEGNDFFVVAVDAQSGEVLVNKQLFHSDNPEPLGNDMNCYASPSPAIEDGRVYIHFGTYGTACLDAETAEVLWERTDIHCRHYRGPGSSPFLYEELLVLTMDGVDVQYVIALDKVTGKTVWKTDRSTAWRDVNEDGEIHREGDMRKAFSTPIIIQVDGKRQLLSVASMTTFAYDPRTGKELWKILLPGYSPSTRPVYSDGLAFVTTGYEETELWAIRPGGEGDLTDSNVAWKIDGPGVPNTPSPLLADGLLYALSDRGMVTCLEAATGEEVWRERIGGNYMASPLYAGGHLYFFSMQGKTTVLKAGRTFEVVGVSELDEGFMASPAVADGDLFLRSKTHLYCIEAD